MTQDDLAGETPEQESLPTEAQAVDEGSYEVLKNRLPSMKKRVRLVPVSSLMGAFH